VSRVGRPLDCDQAAMYGLNRGMPNLASSRDRGIDRAEKQILEEVVIFEVLFIS
jgi:hypothetical protein